MTQRPESRLVTSRTRTPLRDRRQHSAATWKLGACRIFEPEGAGRLGLRGIAGWETFLLGEASFPSVFPG